MKIRHRVGFNVTHKPAIRDALDHAGVRYDVSPLPGDDSALVHFEITESDPEWATVSQLIEAHGASDIVYTVFSDEELLGAEWARIVPTYQKGYPEPQATWVANRTNYEQHCPQCGTYRQSGPFTVRSEPRLGKNDFMSLHWTYALFSSRRVLRKLEEHGISGYEAWDLIIKKTGEPSQAIVQLGVPAVAPAGLVNLSRADAPPCDSCGFSKHEPHRRGVMRLRRDSAAADVDFVQTSEWFGSGHAAYRELLVSAKVVKLIVDQGWKGVALKAVELV